MASASAWPSLELSASASLSINSPARLTRKRERYRTGSHREGGTVASSDLTSTPREGYASQLVPLSIPREYLPAIGKVLKFSDASTEELIKALSSATICAQATDMA